MLQEWATFGILNDLIYMVWRQETNLRGVENVHFTLFTWRLLYHFDFSFMASIRILLEKCHILIILDIIKYTIAFVTATSPSKLSSSMSSSVSVWLTVFKSDSISCLSWSDMLLLITSEGVLSSMFVKLQLI